MTVDFSTFHSRLSVTGRLVFHTAMRIGAGGGGGATEQDLPVLKDLAGRPYVPGSSFKGAFRAHLERLLRGLDPHLACISVPRMQGVGGAPGCLTQEDIMEIKRQETDPEAVSRAILEGTTLTPAGSTNEPVELSGPCWVCRLCGAPWLASKLLVRDMPVLEQTWFDRYLIRDGVAIDRDTETAAANLKYDYEAVPAETEFTFELMVDNATDAELGLALLGLREFEAGRVTLGGGRSRGLGWVTLELDWDEATLIKQADLRSYLLEGPAKPLAEETARRKYWEAFMDAVAPAPATGGTDA